MKMSDLNVIVWDFDGVILFSNEVREAGFVSIFEDYDKELIEKLLDFHRTNGGLSRYVKIRYFFEELLNQPISDEQVEDLAGKFSEIMKSKLSDTNYLNPDWLNFMKVHHSSFTHHIASGSDEVELRGLCKSLGIEHYFISIHGSPTPKNTLVSEIMNQNRYSTKNVVLIGDAINDFEAASVNSIQFRGYNNTTLRGYGDYLNYFGELLK